MPINLKLEHKARLPHDATACKDIEKGLFCHLCTSNCCPDFAPIGTFQPLSGASNQLSGLLMLLQGLQDSSHVALS
jgi:hypothetical protein